jgi:hypothetical protein
MLIATKIFLFVMVLLPLEQAMNAAGRLQLRASFDR